MGPMNMADDSSPGDSEDLPPLPLVIVKVLDSIPLAGIDTGVTLTLDQLATQAGVGESAELDAVRALSSDLSLSWAFVSVSSSDIANLVSRATEEDPDYAPPSFDHYFEAVCQGGLDGGALADALGAWSDVVEFAYLQDVASDPLVVATGNPFFTNGSQGYLSPAPIGVDAPAAWAKGADGGGLTFFDVEQGWFFDHQDLPKPIPLRQGSNRTTSFAHGAAVLGEIVGADDTLGMVGAAPASIAQVVSYNDDFSSPLQVQRLADRILSAANALPFGNVLLLEVQISGVVAGSRTAVPAEADPLVFESIKLASKAGVIVVEAAGNGNADLDTFVMDKGPRKGARTLSRDNPTEFAESGAIMVGGCTSDFPHNRFASSNFGSRIDCFAWAENIVTSGWDSANPSAADVYWGVNLNLPINGVPQAVSFGGTSGASPVIVGCCLLVQHLRDILTPNAGSGKLGGASMRALLSNPNNGTPSFLVTDRIGVMPDLAKIIANEFQP
jgi:hypothetical protein